MYFLKKSTLEFDKIKESGYEIDEQPNLIDQKQFVNGKRKKIVTAYTDVIIKINIGGLNYSDIETYLDALVDGDYTYYSFNDRTYKTAKFIVTIPSIKVKKAMGTTEYYMDDLEIVLEKSDDSDSSI